MSQIVRERILHTFAHVFEMNSNAEFAMLFWGKENILTKPYVQIGGSV